MTTNAVNPQKNIIHHSGCGDTSFILCTPTKNENGCAQADNVTSTGCNYITLKPRRSSQHHGSNSNVCQKDDVDLILDEITLSASDFSSTDTDTDSLCDFITECSSLHLSSRQSPPPMFQSIDVMLTSPPLRSRRMFSLMRRDLKREGYQGSDDDDDSSINMELFPRFPILSGDVTESKEAELPIPTLRRRDVHLWEEQPSCPKLYRPIPRYHRQQTE